MENQAIKIFVVYHRDSPRIEHEPFVPIQVGSGAPLGMLRDNTGDNISAKNPNYCELTAQYWIWKNVKDADVVGLCHYRRIPSFTNDDSAEFSDFSEETCQRFGWTQERISDLMRENDILLPPCWAVFPVGEPGNVMSPYDFYARHHRENDMRVALDVIREKTPELADSAERVLLQGTEQCFGCISVMRKSLFDAYSEWLFTVLFEVEKRITLPKNREEARLFGFLAEALLNVWVDYAKRTLGVRVFFGSALPTMNYEGADVRLETQICVPARERVENPLLSVVIPVYNVAKYLHKCLNTVCNQCFEDLEIICVNDGSTDRSREILAAFAERDKRIRIIDQKNRGLGAARNRGIDEACGKYLAFVDSDDWVDRFIWQYSVRKAERLNLEMLLFELDDVLDESGEIRWNPYNKLWCKKECLRGAFTWREWGRNPFETNCYAPSRIVRRDFLGERRFPEGVLYEDAALHFDLLFSAKRLGALAFTAYFYRIRKTSLMAVRDVRVLDHLKVIDDVARALSRNGIFDETKDQFLAYANGLLIKTYSFLPTRKCFDALRKWRRLRADWGWRNDPASRALLAGKQKKFERICFGHTEKKHSAEKIFSLIPEGRFRETLVRLVAMFILNRAARKRFRARHLNLDPRYRKK